MKIIFNDATELQVQSVACQGDYLSIKAIGISPEEFRAIFSDPVKTKKMIVEERGKQTTYEGYTTFYRSEEYPGKIYGIVNYRPDKTPEVQAEVQAAAVEVARLQAQSLSDTDALTVKDIYPLWKDVIGKTVDNGFKFLYEDVLYKTIQNKLLIQEQYIPGQGTEALYTVINEEHAGTADDPIPYDNNMELEEGNYYRQDGVTYYCNRSTGQPVYNALADLVGLYVEVV